MSLITADDVAARLMLKLDADQEAGIAAIIVEAQTQLEAWLGRPVEVREVTGEQHLLAAGQAAIFLKATPVAAVSAFTIDGTAQDASWYVTRTWGVEMFSPFASLSDPPRALLDYTGGLDGSDQATNPGIRSVLLRACARETKKTLADAVGLKRLSVEGLSVEFEEMFTEQELARLRRYKRRRAS